MHNKMSSAQALKFAIALCVALAATVYCLFFPPIPGFSDGKLLVLIVILPPLILFTLYAFLCLVGMKKE